MLKWFENKALYEYYDQCVNEIDVKTETYLLNTKDNQEIIDINAKRSELLNHFEFKNRHNFVIFIDYKPSFINDEKYIGKLIVHNDFNGVDINALK